MPINYSNSASTANVLIGASANTVGTVGLVPAAAAGNTKTFLRSDGAWSTIPSVGTVDPIATNDSTKGFGIGSFWLNSTTGKVFVCRSPSAGAAIWSAVGANGQTVFIATATTNGQTSFTLPSVPTNPSAAVMSVNGIEYFNTVDFTLAGSTVTWLNEFTISPADEIIFSFN